MKPQLTVHVDGRIFQLNECGGIFRVFVELLRQWRNMEALHVCLYLLPGANVSSCRDLANEVVVLPDCKPWRPAGFFQEWNETRARRARLRAWRELEDGLYISSYYSTHESLRIPQLLVLHDMIYEQYPDLFQGRICDVHRTGKRACVEAAAALACPSKHALIQASQAYNLGNRLTRVIPYAISECFLAPPQPKNHKAVHQRYTDGHEFILCVGGRGNHKNFVGLLAAYARWPQRQKIHLLAVGGGFPGVQDSTLVECLGLKDVVHFAPDVPDAELVSVYHASRALVVPSISEGYGLPVIEGLAAGRPVAASQGGSLPEVGGDVAIYFDPRDGDSILEAIQEAVDMSEDSPRLARGRQLAASRTWEQVAQEYAQFMQEVYART